MSNKTCPNCRKGKLVTFTEDQANIDGAVIVSPEKSFVIDSDKRGKWDVATGETSGRSIIEEEPKIEGPPVLSKRKYDL